MARVAAIIGGGVVGAGWAARFLLNGWDVRLFDPDPATPDRVGAVLARARRALAGLGDVALPAEGTLSFCGLISETVTGADWIQESVPERLELKQTLFRKLQEHADEGAILASSTSGLTPSELQAGLSDPGRILVCHPLDPVYLLPLVEVVHSDKNHPDLIDRARDTLAELGMFALRVRGEITAHVADRLQEALWREALWLVRDEVAQVGEVDEALRMGPGLRWAQMGPFESARIAAGEEGMEAFLRRIGPALNWSRSKLTEVPELDPALIARIVEQSDDASGHMTLDELRDQRDRTLVALLRSLSADSRGAGAVLRRRDKARAEGRAMPRRIADLADPSQPILTVDRAVPLDWLDDHDRMTGARHLEAFGQATDRLLEILGCTPEYIAAGKGFLVTESHIRQLDAAQAGAPLRICSRVLGAGDGRLHLWHEMMSGARLLASAEHLLEHADLDTRQTCAPDPALAEAMRQLARAQARTPAPEGAGRVRPG
ncbi:L-carnitine dehydrogenase [Pseudooceanicola nanhaiensis]|jgi:carnitine 3-dehydrogenase|uniref:L-carnitine dehydrogenase n=1 Tax=Pseudooceanicola nanhaiensis TaxID=375761 RepID=A0A917SJX1_9RHOB|nr:3-hydroxyacyl-CoA dehydrogenase NAD-binding domain-containing protein [Pseudooceanicola nanhaiensis]GGL84977.1 L-carnitine dehydrogenase [Pseudooceanicola nanhaiensis]